MSNERSGAKILVSDGTGGLREITDLRFDSGDFPIELVVDADDALAWMSHLQAEAEERGWGIGGLSQLDETENSGTLSLNAGPPANETIEIVWEKSRRGALRLRARTQSGSNASLSLVNDLFDATTARHNERRLTRVHRWALLAYQGLPWRGELWLDKDTRLGPPSKFPNGLLAKQVVIADVMCEGIGQNGALADFHRRLTEIRLFIAVVTGDALAVSSWGEDWVCDVDEHGRITDCKRGYVGYVELTGSRPFPKEHSVPPIEKRDVVRPGLGPDGISADMGEFWVPTDIEKLWSIFKTLPIQKREQFLCAANAYALALSLWRDQRTACAAFLVVACEALKPAGRRFRNANVYDVVGSLMTPAVAVDLRRQSHAPQRVRSVHFHRGQLLGGELLPLMMYDYFHDPSFDSMLRQLATVSRTCLIEWLRCGGRYHLARQKRESHGGPWSLSRMSARVLILARSVRHRARTIFSTVAFRLNPAKLFGSL